MKLFKFYLKQKDAEYIELYINMSQNSFDYVVYGQDVTLEQWNTNNKLSIF